MSTRLVTILGGKGHHPPLGCPLGRVTTALPSPASPGLPQSTSTPRAEQPPREVQALVCEGWEAPSACFAFSVAPCHRNLCVEARQEGLTASKAFACQLLGCNQALPRWAPWLHGTRRGSSCVPAPPALVTCFSWTAPASCHRTTCLQAHLRALRPDTGNLAQANPPEQQHACPSTIISVCFGIDHVPDQTAWDTNCNYSWVPRQ